MKANFARDCLIKIAGKKSDPRNRKHIQAAIEGGVDPALFVKLDPKIREGQEKRARANFVAKKEAADTAVLLYGHRTRCIPSLPSRGVHLLCCLLAMSTCSVASELIHLAVRPRCVSTSLMPHVPIPVHGVHGSATRPRTRR